MKLEVEGVLASAQKKKFKVEGVLASPKKMKVTRARRAFVSLTYRRSGARARAAGKKKDKDKEEFRKFLESFTFTGCASGEADSIQVTLNNRDGRFFKKWRPRKKDRLHAEIITKYWKKGQKRKSFNCGTFLIESFEGSGPPMVFVINATSVPESSSFRSTERDKSWKKARLKEVAGKIAKRYHMKLVFDGEDFPIGTVEQSNETDCAFLTGLCESYAYGIKFFSGRIIIYSKEKYEKKEEVGVLRKAQMADYRFESNLCGTYTGAKMKYTDPDTDKEVTVKVGKGNRWLRVSGDAGSVSQAKRKAAAALRTQNEKAEVFECSIRGNTRFHETDVVRIQGFGQASGRYFIDQVVHRLDAQGGFTTEFSMHRASGKPRELLVKAALSSQDGIVIQSALSRNGKG